MFDTVEQLQEYLKEHVSEKRYIHSVGVAETTKKVMEHYHKEIEVYKNFDAAIFCGIAHDLGREYSDEEIITYCRKNNIKLSKEQEISPVLAHGMVSADLAEKLCGKFPKSWKRAIEIHTTGDANMDDLGLALFIADMIEPSRTFMTDESRQRYLSAKDIKTCAYLILSDMLDHWKTKHMHQASEGSLKMLEFLGGSN